MNNSSKTFHKRKFALFQTIIERLIKIKIQRIRTISVDITG